MMRLYRNSDVPYLGIALGVFKAAQLIRGSSFTNHFRDFTAIDIETTDRDLNRAELVEIAATRVRDGRIVDEFHSLVRPRVQISAGARNVHGYSEQDLETAPWFEDIWPAFRDFCGRDVLVAHNGYGFDFPILRRMAKDLGDTPLSTYDTLVLARELHSGGARLEDLCNVYGIAKGRLHHALDDTKALALVFLCLGDTKVARARKTALDNLLDFVGMALALSDQSSLCDEAKRLAGLVKIYPLGRYSSCLEFYGQCEKSEDSADFDRDFRTWRSKLMETCGRKVGRRSLPCDESHAPAARAVRREASPRPDPRVPRTCRTLEDGRHRGG